MTDDKAKKIKPFRGAKLIRLEIDVLKETIDVLKKDPAQT